MKKINRLKRNEDFDKIIREGKKVVNKSFIIYYLPSLSSYSYFRIGISVGKKNGNAVLRNKTKRQIRMMIDQTKPQTFDYVVIVRKLYFEKDFQTNLLLLQKIFRSIK